MSTSPSTARCPVDARGTPVPSSPMSAESVAEVGIAADQKHDAVHSPPHYTVGGIETRDFIAAKRLNFNRGNVVKYTVRAGLKDPSAELEDLLKARSYLEDEIARVKAAAFVLPTPIYSCSFPVDNVSRGLRELASAAFAGVVAVDLSDCGDR